MGILKELAIRAHYRVGELATLLKVKRRTLERRFRIELRITPESWLKTERLDAAERLLVAGKSVKEVAVDLGFSDSAMLSHQFRSRNKMTTKEYVSLFRSEGAN